MLPTRRQLDTAMPKELKLRESQECDGSWPIDWTCLRRRMAGICVVGLPVFDPHGGQRLRRRVASQDDNHDNNYYCAARGFYE